MNRLRCLTIVSICNSSSIIRFNYAVIYWAHIYRIASRKHIEASYFQLIYWLAGLLSIWSIYFVACYLLSVITWTHLFIGTYGEDKLCYTRAVCVFNFSGKSNTKQCSEQIMGWAKQPEPFLIAWQMIVISVFPFSFPITIFSFYIFHRIFLLQSHTWVVLGSLETRVKCKIAQWCK